MYRWPLELMMLVLTVLSAACGSQDSNDLPVYGKIPDFSLTDQMGQDFTSEELQGRVFLANFIFTNCTEFCPTLTPRMGQIQTDLEDDDLLGNEVILLSFSVDPAHDTPNILRSYAEKHGVNHDAWRFLTGPPEVIQRVITDGLMLAYGQVNESNKHTHEDGSVHIHEYDVFHTNRVVLGDRAGRVRAYYDGAIDWDAAKVMKDISQLLD
ncbi:MAG: SCO family protein [Chloroflexi bacterium]|nr:SCO family protein [Chloroflexota bacterium]